MADLPIKESEIVLILLESAHKDLGLGVQSNWTLLDHSLGLFFQSRDFREVKAEHFSNPTNQRGGIADDWNLQQFTIDITRRWKLFLIARMNYVVDETYETGPNKERSY